MSKQGFSSTVFANGIFRRVVSSIIAVSFSLTSLTPIYAQSLTPDNQAPASQRPSLERAPNDVPIVNIVRPNANGLSHNKFKDFNVGKKGLILNNSKTVGRSVLGGQILGNPNLKDGNNARLILNEVTGNNGSLLEGHTEIFGSQAEYILANPNGITCNGCGFINIPRATLSTGVPIFNPNTGAFNGLDVNRGVISIGELGLDASSTDFFDIVSRSIAINGAIHGKDLGLLSGRNEFNYALRQITAKTDDGSTKPIWGIDSTLLGGAYANRILLLGTEDGVGVRAPKEIVARTGRLTISSNGRLIVRKAKAKKRVYLKNKSHKLEITDKIYSDEDVVISTEGDFTTQASVAALKDVTVNARTVELLGNSALLGAGLTEDGDLTSTGNLKVVAINSITTGLGILTAGADIELESQTVTFSRSADDNTANIRNGGDLVINSENLTGTNGRVNTDGDISLFSAANLALTGGVYQSGKDITVIADALNTTADLEAQGLITITTRVADLINSGDINSKDNLNVNVAGALTNSGKISSEKELEITSGTKVTNETNGLLAANDKLTITASNLENKAEIGSRNNDLALNINNDIDNSGRFYAGQDLDAKLDGIFTNFKGEVIAERDLKIAGLTGERAVRVRNVSGKMEALSGDVLLKALEVINEKEKFRIEQVHTQTSSTSGLTRTTINTYTDTVVEDSVAPQILAARDILIDATTITNNFGQIAANRDISLKGTVLTNSAQDLTKRTDTTIRTSRFEKYCARRIFGICVSRKTREIVTTSSSTNTETIDTKFAAINAGRNITGDFTGRIDNTTIRENVDQFGLSSGGREVSTLGEPGAFNFSRNFSNAALFITAPEPEASFLFETRSEFIDRSQFFSSDYFLSRVGVSASGQFNSQDLQKRLTDGYGETQLIRQQIFELTGLRLLDGYNSDFSQIKGLYDNALEVSKELNWKPGQKLSADQVAALTKDIIWLEEITVNGQKVLAPKVYIANARKNYLYGAKIAARGDVKLNAPQLNNTGQLKAKKQLIAKADDINNVGGSIEGEKKVDLEAKNQLNNLSGKIKSSDGDVNIKAGELNNNTLITRDQRKNGYNDRLHQRAEIEAKNNLDIKTDGDVNSEAGKFKAGRDVNIDAGGDVNLKAGALDNSREDTFKGGYDKEFSRKHEKAGVEAGGNVTIKSEKDTKLKGVDIKAGETAKITAKGNVKIENVQDIEQKDFYFKNKGKGLFGADTERSRKSYKEETQVSNVVTAKDLKIESKDKDITIDATNLKSGGKTELKADKGQVALLSDTDKDFAQEKNDEEDLFWWNKRDKGHNKDTIHHVKIDAGGGLTITAGKGVIAEYKATGNLNASIDQLSKKPGLEWMDQVKNRKDVNWKGVQAAYEEWDHKTQGLTEAGSAVIALAVSVATAGTGSAFAAGLGFAKGTIGHAAISAGVNKLITQASISLINNQGDFGAVLKELGSSASLRSLATAIVTAGLTTGITDAAGLNLNLPKDATVVKRVSQDLQRNLVRAVVSSSVSTAIQGGDFGENLLSDLRLAAASTIGATVAKDIHAATETGSLNSVTKLIAHAVLGCATGSIGSGDCAGGAAGGVAGEIVGDLYKQRLQKVEDTLDKIIALSSEDGKITTLEAAQLNDIRKDLYDLKSEGVDVASLAGGLAAAFAGGDVNTGADAGGNAAENNALCLGICIGIGAAIAAIVVALEVADKVLVAQDAINLTKAIAACDGGNQAACGQAQSLAIELGAGVAADVVPVPGGKVGLELLQWVRKNVDGDALQQVNRIARNVCSFHGDTLVQTNLGFTPIRELRVSKHKVWSRNPANGEMSYKALVAQYSNPYKETVSVRIRDVKTGAEQTIVSNRIHPYFTKRPEHMLPLKLVASNGHDYQGPIKGGEWVNAEHLKKGFQLLNGNEGWSEVISVTIEKKPLKAYNLTVADFHTYFVKGAANDNVQPVWVHNDCFTSLNWKGFGKKKAGEHYDKHGASIGAKNTDDYIAKAKDFAKVEADGKDVLATPVKGTNFVVKVQKSTGKVLIGKSNKREFSTFYKNDGRVSSDELFDAAVQRAKEIADGDR